MQDYKVLFNSGLSFEDTITINIKATSKEEALELALQENTDLSGWNYYVTKNS
jgi:hypothetical protein